MRALRIAVPSAAVAIVVGGSALLLQPSTVLTTAEPAAAVRADVTPDREARANRGNARPDLGVGAVVQAAADQQLKQRRAGGPDRLASLPKPTGAVYATGTVNLRAAATADGRLIDTVEGGTRLIALGAARKGWQPVSYRGDNGFVSADYVSAKKPVATSESAAGSSTTSGSGSASSSGSASGGVSGGACASSSVKRGLQPNAVAVHRAICNAFPAITSYGGVRADSLAAHPSGRALDSMIPGYSSSAGNALGWQVANYARANAGRLGITEVIFDQKIWTTQRSGEGWRPMSNRGGATANHRDHVHVTVR